MSADRVPAFIVIGAVKAATTWLAHQLRLHPALWLPNSEPHYFSDEYARGPEWYLSLFAPAPPGRFVGEKSADYLAHPDAPERIAATLPDVRLIVQLRDPVERAYSDYCMLFRRGQVDGDLRRYLTRPEGYGARFLEGGEYAKHLKRYFSSFRREQIHILLYEDVRDQPKAVIGAICKHIGVDTHLAPTEAKSRFNDSKAALLPLGLRRVLKPMRPLLDPLRKVPWLATARAAIARPVEYPALTDELREMLQNFYDDDIGRLEDMLSRDLSMWRTDVRHRELFCA